MNLGQYIGEMLTHGHAGGQEWKRRLTDVPREDASVKREIAEPTGPRGGTPLAVFELLNARPDDARPVSGTDIARALKIDVTKAETLYPVYVALGSLVRRKFIQRHGTCGSYMYTKNLVLAE